MIRQLYIGYNHIILLVTLLCMLCIPESQHCRSLTACRIRLPNFAAAFRCSDLVSGIGYSTVPYFGPLGWFWYSSLTTTIIHAQSSTSPLSPYTMTLWLDICSCALDFHCFSQPHHVTASYVSPDDKPPKAGGRSERTQ